MIDLHSRIRDGFTAIELAMVVSVLAIVASMSTPGLLRSLRHGQVHDAANAIARTCGQARQLSRTCVAGPEHYGVVIVNGDATTRGYVAVTYGTTATAADVLEVGSKPVARIELARDVVVLKGGAPLTDSDAESGWLFDYQTDHCMAAPYTEGDHAVNITGLAVSTLDGRYSRGIAVYRVGMVSIQGD